VQGFIYNLLLNSKYDYLHDKEGFKFFCFSNIFPVTKYLDRNSLRTLIISSPDSEFILYLYENLKRRWNAKSEISIGSMVFRIDSIDKLFVNIPNNTSFVLTTGTPIIVRVPREKYREYSIEPSKNYEYIYWRFKHPIDLFLSQIESNLSKKYDEYHKPGNDMKIPMRQSSLFQKFKFRKQISTRILMKNAEQIIIGTLWDFGFEGSEDKILIQFALDTGLGERNSMGFGFMNIKQ
jgi:CRISPR-associated endoribonuclease Cas6